MVFSPQEVGRHQVSICRNGQGPIGGSPFDIIVKQAEIASSEQVKVYGTGLADGSTNQPCQFYIDTTDAGS